MSVKYLYKRLAENPQDGILYCEPSTGDNFTVNTAGHQSFTVLSVDHSTFLTVQDVLENGPSDGLAHIRAVIQAIGVDMSKVYYENCIGDETWLNKKEHEESTMNQKETYEYCMRALENSDYSDITPRLFGISSFSVPSGFSGNYITPIYEINNSLIGDHDAYPKNYYPMVTSHKFNYAKDGPYIFESTAPYFVSYFPYCSNGRVAQWDTDPVRTGHYDVYGFSPEFCLLLQDTGNTDVFLGIKWGYTDIGQWPIVFDNGNVIIDTSRCWINYDLITPPEEYGIESIEHRVCSDIYSYQSKWSPIGGLVGGLVVQKIDLNLIPGGVLPVVHVDQYDTGARVITAKIYNGNVLADLSPVSKVTIRGTKPSKTGFIHDDICTINTDDSTVTFPLFADMTVVSGPVRCDMSFTTSAGDIGTLSFILAVQPAGLTTDTIIDSSDFNGIIEATTRDVVTEYLKKIWIESASHELNLAELYADEIAEYSDVWAWIKNRIVNGNYTGISVGDYIPFVTENNVSLNAQIAGIDTYTGCGSPNIVGHHIDFICKELWSIRKQYNLVAFNNGINSIRYPWLASYLYYYTNSLSGTVPSEAEPGGGTGTAVDFTADGIYYNLPAALKAVIVQKRMKLSQRYSEYGLLTADSRAEWTNAGYLWLPNEVEVFGLSVYGDKTAKGAVDGAVQYPLFAHNMKRVKYYASASSPITWWLLPGSSGDSTNFICVNPQGDANSSVATFSSGGIPVCFRIS